MIAEIPEGVDLTKVLLNSTLLNKELAKCCCGPYHLPNHESLDICKTKLD